MRNSQALLALAQTCALGASEERERMPVWTQRVNCHKRALGAIVAEKQGRAKMKDIHEVVRQKELEIERLKKEIKALRTVIPMLEDKE